MSKMKIQSSTVEEKFMFGSPPLLNGFSYTSCRSQEGVYQTNYDCCSYEDDCSEEENNRPDNVWPSMMNGDIRSIPSYSRSYQHPPHCKRNYFSNGHLLENFHNFSNGTKNAPLVSHVDDGIKLLEQAGIKVQASQKPVFRKRKDLRVLKSVLSNERFREVVMKFGDGDEGGREIVDSVHKAMKNSNLSSVSCLFCASESMVYENFPVVDGTLFLTPVWLSSCCIKFSESTSEKDSRYMSYICVQCMEGRSKTLRCSSCTAPWNGSFFQIGTLYSYNILSAMPCCQQRVSCKKCCESIIDLSNGEAFNLFFSYFSKKVTCPHCQTDDFHYVKSLSSISHP